MLIKPELALGRATLESKLHRKRFIVAARALFLNQRFVSATEKYFINRIGTKRRSGTSRATSA
jgi:hypothetical protein